MARTLAKRKRKKQPSIKSCKTKAWIAVRSRVFARERACVTCGEPGDNLGHFIHTNEKPSKSVSGNYLWYDIRNLHRQCRRCNLFLHGNLIVYTLFMIHTYGTDTVVELFKHKSRSKTWTREEILEIAGVGI